MKYTKKKSKYRTAVGQRKCSNCKHYNQWSKTCNKVEGYVSPNAVCNYWYG